MSSIQYLMGMLMTFLQSHPLCDQAAITETRAFSADQFFFKIRAGISGGYNFQTRIYYNQGHIDYAYQLFTHIPILRWDNKEEFPHLETYPHHHHDEKGNIKASSLSGDPGRDIKIVLDEVSVFISRKDADVC